MKRAAYWALVVIMFAGVIITPSTGCRGEEKVEKEARIVMVFAPHLCCDEEFIRLKAHFEQHNIEVIAASTTANVGVGERLGLKVLPNITISQIEVESCDAIVVNSGTGCKEFLWNDTSLREVIRDAFARNKVIAAGCIAPVVLARTGILQDREATVLVRPGTIEELEKGGAIYRDEAVVVSGNIITGRDLEALDEFAEAILEKLAPIIKAHHLRCLDE